MADPKLTRNQTVVIDALKRANKPLSAYQVLDDARVRAKGLKAPLTIYRALDKLVEQGAVHRIETLNAFVACDHGAHRDPAAFMICTACKTTIEFPVGAVQRTMTRQARDFGFTIDSIHLEITGLCDSCAAAA